MTRRVPMPGQVLRVADLSEYSAGREDEVTSLGEANIITSEIAERPGRHRVVLDIDHWAKLVPSSTPGHSHLYVDYEMSRDEYLNLMWTMADVGLLEEGYVSASNTRGYSAVRLPWVRK